MKKTAVEWYGLQIGILISKFFNNEISKSEVHFKRIEIEEQAKEMEKQQMIEMHDKGFDSVEQLNDEFAIEFTEWLLKKYDGVKSVKELLEIYKKQIR
jgi:reverse gyrase